MFKKQQVEGFKRETIRRICRCRRLRARCRLRCRAQRGQPEPGARRVNHVMGQPQTRARPECASIASRYVVSPVPTSSGLLYSLLACGVMPPRRNQPTKSPKRLRQKKLDAFVPSSPGPSTSPARSSRRRKKPGRTGHDEHNPENKLHAGGEGDGSESSDPGAIRFEPKIVIVSSSEEEAAPKSSPLNKGKRRLRRAHSEDSDIKAPSGDEEEEDFSLRKGQGKRIARKPAAVLESDEEEEERPVPKKRKLVKGARPPTPEEEEVDLMDEVDEGSK